MLWFLKVDNDFNSNNFYLDKKKPLVFKENVNYFP
jgi:hypothetical protein